MWDAKLAEVGEVLGPARQKLVERLEHDERLDRLVDFAPDAAVDIGHRGGRNADVEQGRGNPPPAKRGEVFIDA